MAAGLGFVPEDRRQQGLVMDLGIDQNVALASLGRLTSVRADPSNQRTQPGPHLGTAAPAELRPHEERGLDSLRWQPAEGRARPSGWRASPPLLIIDEPTRGIDVGTKAEVHRILDGLVSEGVAVLMISSELPEVLGMADRVLVLREGRLAAELSRAEADEDSIMRAATGQIVESPA